ncbi:uncharacterized protein LOC144120493 [Amblyomma americanum]
MARTKATGFRSVVFLFACTAACTTTAAGDGPCEISGGYNYKRLFTTTWFVPIQGIGPCVTLGASNCSWKLQFCSNDKVPPPECGRDTACETYATGKVNAIGNFRALVPNGQNSFVAKFEEPGLSTLKCSEASRTMKLNVIFTCDSQKHLPIGPGSLLTNLDYSSIEDKDPCERNITVPYEGACGTAPSGGLSTGSVLLILFFVALLIYLVGGILINRHNGAEGVEMIPHLQFWKELPSLVVEGGVFFVQVVTCQGGGSSRTYDNI